MGIRGSYADSVPVGCGRSMVWNVPYRSRGAEQPAASPPRNNAELTMSRRDRRYPPPAPPTRAPADQPPEWSGPLPARPPAPPTRVATRPDDGAAMTERTATPTVATPARPEPAAPPADHPGIGPAGHLSGRLVPGHTTRPTGPTLGGLRWFSWTPARRLRDVAIAQRTPARTDALVARFDGASPAERSRDCRPSRGPATGRRSRRECRRVRSAVSRSSGGHRLGAAARAGVGLITSDRLGFGGGSSGWFVLVWAIEEKSERAQSGWAAKRVSHGGPRRRFVLTGPFAPRKKRQAVVRFGVKQPP